MLRPQTVPSGAGSEENAGNWGWEQAITLQKLGRRMKEELGVPVQGSPSSPPPEQTCIAERGSDGKGPAMRRTLVEAASRGSGFGPDAT